MVKCLTEEHNMLVTARLEPATFGLRVNGLIHCATRAHLKHLEYYITCLLLQNKNSYKECDSGFGKIIATL